MRCCYSYRIVQYWCHCVGSHGCVSWTCLPLAASSNFPLIPSPPTLIFLSSLLHSLKRSFLWLSHYSNTKQSLLYLNKINRTQRTGKTSAWQQHSPTNLIVMRNEKKKDIKDKCIVEYIVEINIWSREIFSRGVEKAGRWGGLRCYQWFVYG